MIIEPKSDQEWETYNEIRWITLRKPWGQPKGSEITEGDDTAFHAMYLENERPLGVIRLHKVEDGIFQIRTMGVIEEARGKGIGKKLTHYMENLAKAKGGNKVILHARENAVGFYESSGYKIKDKSYLLFDEIQHYLMEKPID